MEANVSLAEWSVRWWGCGVVSVFDQLADNIRDGLGARFCTNTDEMLRRLRWAAQNFPLAIPSPQAIFASFLPVGCDNLPPQPTGQFIPGGQCEGVLYRVVVDRVNGDGTVLADVTFTNVVGPITGVRVEWITNNFFQQPQAIVVVDAPNDLEPPTPGQRRFGPASVFDPDRRTRAVLKRLERMDGQPDNCGVRPEPPIEEPEQPPPGQLPPITINIGGGPVTFSPTFNFRPAINIPVNAGVHIPIDINIAPNIFFPTGTQFPVYLRLPDLNINTTLTGPLIDLDIGGGSGGGGVVEIPYVQRIVGVRVQSQLLSNHKVTTIVDAQSGNNLYVPRLAVVRFRPPAFVSEQLSIDIDVKTLDQFVPCPWFYGAASFDVFPNVGVGAISTPLVARVADFYRPV